MNQDQVKEILLQIEEDVEEFFVIFSGKSSTKVNGLYHPDSREIIIHNKNFENDQLLLYTAIHEYAHHVHITRSPIPVGSRAHTIEFRRIFHELLNVAEQKGFVRNVFEADQDFAVLTESIKKNMIGPQGELARKLGEAFIQAQSLCEAKGYRFEDYIERVLQFDTTTARTLMKARSFELPAELGYENMKLVASVADSDNREVLKSSLMGGSSRDTAKFSIKKPEAEDPITRLLKEKKRIEKTIDSLSKKLEQVNMNLEKIEVEQ
ncbi:MAG: hypothetical protein PQJ61_03095 [Spirochaetales bacterium]|uniref:Uncharacterized protein n=1 Tax=Candidatus Thalassospirochaeta sargassi TaxID=3119039 RepID=A0AAJ1IAM2_9SPIO|nr:hypothetical protein [Spirochaetales bacterium]